MQCVLGNPFITEDVVLAAICLVEQKLKTGSLIPAIFDVNHLQAITPKHILLGNRIIPLSLSTIFIMLRVIC